MTNTSLQYHLYIISFSSPIFPALLHFLKNSQNNFWIFFIRPPTCNPKIEYIEFRNKIMKIVKFQIPSKKLSNFNIW